MNKMIRQIEIITLMYHFIKKKKPPLTSEPGGFLGSNNENFMAFG